MLQHPHLTLNQATKLANAYLKALEDFGKPNAPLEAYQLENVLCPDLKIISNDTLVVSNLIQFIERYKIIKKKFPSITISKLLEQLIFEKNKMVILYNFERVSIKGDKLQAQVMGIMTVKQGKICHIRQVIHEKGSGQVDP